MRKENLFSHIISKYGEQKIYKFSNGYGASVIKNEISYGHEFGLWELCPMTFISNNVGKLCKIPEISKMEVVGFLTEKGVNELLNKIEKL